MDEAKDILKLVRDTFADFRGQWLEKYNVGMRSELVDRLKGSRMKCFNSLLQTEADVQMLFGGLLSTVLCRPRNLFVHAELPIYGTESDRCDLTIHAAPPNGIIDDVKVRRSTLISAIEIKYANYRDPNIQFSDNEVSRDITRMGKHVPRHLLKFLLIVDEANSVSDKHIARTLQEAMEAGVEILSNNPKFARQ